MMFTALIKGNIITLIEVVRWGNSLSGAFKMELNIILGVIIVIIFCVLKVINPCR